MTTIQTPNAMPCELENTGLIRRATHLNDVGEHVFTGAFFIPVSDQITY